MDERSMKDIIFDADRIRTDVTEALKGAHRLLTTIAQRQSEYDALLIRCRRAGFNDACDRLGIPAADTPMERIALAGGDTAWRE